MTRCAFCPDGRGGVYTLNKLPCCRTCMRDKTRLPGDFKIGVPSERRAMEIAL